MQNVLRPSGAKATVLPRDRFWTARTQLTVTYTAILAVILCISSGIIYTAFSSRIAQRFERFPMRPPMMLPEGVIPPRAEDVLQDLITSLILVNSLLLVLASVSSYWLAGITLEPIQETYERQRRFLSDASHELRTPLAILQADLENSLSDPTLSPAWQEQATSHLEEVGRMGQIVKDLLLLSRLDEASIPEEASRSFDLVSFSEALVLRFQTLAKSHDVCLSFQSSVPTCPIVSKSELLTQALSNILKNAILYNKPKGTIAFSLTKERSNTLLTIEDSGIGISSQDLNKLFERFYRVDKSRSRQTGGSGLGLAISRSIIEQLHGTIEIQSELGQGTRVTIQLPLEQRG